MFNNIFKYVDRIMSIVRPRKLVYLAVDGVAPRAKMNQQRSRRFRTAMDARVKAQKEITLKEQWLQEGRKPPKEWSQTTTSIYI